MSSFTIPVSLLLGEQLMARKVRVCPRCGSTRLSEMRSPVSGWLVPTSYYCEDCHYSGPIYAEVDADELGQLQEAMRAKSEEGTSSS